MIKVAVVFVISVAACLVGAHQEGHLPGKYVLVNSPVPTPCELPMWPASGYYILSTDSTWNSRHDFDTAHCDEQWHEFHGTQLESGIYSVAGDTVLLYRVETGGRRVESAARVLGDTLLIPDESGDLKYFREGA